MDLNFTDNTVNVTAEQATTLIPVCELQPGELQKLLSKSLLLKVPRGQKLVSSELSRWMIYLLQGQLQLYDHDNYAYLLLSGSAKTNKTIFDDNQHHYVAIAEQNCQLALFDREYFNTLANQSLLSAEELETIEVSDSGNYVFQAIMQAYNNGNLELPALPEIAVKIQQAMRAPDVDIDAVSRILDADPVMVARLLQVANSPIHKGAGPVNSIRSAIIRIGLKTTKELVICLALKQLFNAESPLLMQRMRQCYEDSTEVSAIAYAIAKHATDLEPDSMLLAGLIHDIGVIPVLNYIDKTGLLIENISQVESVITALKAVVGSMVVTMWGLGEELLDVVENADDCQQKSSDKIETCDVIVISSVYHRLQHHDTKHVPKLAELPSFNKIFPKKDMNLISTILDEASEEVNEIKRLLKS